MVDPNKMAARLPRWMRVVLLGCVTVFAVGLGLFTYHYLTRPHVLTVAAGSLDGEAATLMSTIASRLASTNTSVRLKVTDSGSALDASRAFSSGKVDLAVVRGDLGDLSAARAVVLLTHVVVMIAVPPGSSIEDIDGLKGKTVGVVGGEVNHHLVEVLSREYDLAAAKVRFKDLALAEAQEAVKRKQVSALLIVLPLTEKYLTLARNLFPRSSKSQPGLIAIESAGAIANVAKPYESFDLPKGTLRGSPAVPDDDLTTLRVPVYLVANKNLSDDDMTELARAIMDTRRDLVGAHPILAQIASPSTESDAFIPIHPGAKTYFDGEQKSFFDKYGDALFYGPMAIGALTTLFAGVWKFVGVGADTGRDNLLGSLGALADRIRDAGSPADLAAVEDEIDAILMAELGKYTSGDAQATDAAVLSMAAQRLEQLMSRRRSALVTRGVTTPDDSLAAPG